MTWAQDLKIVCKNLIYGGFSLDPLKFVTKRSNLVSKGDIKIFRTFMNIVFKILVSGALKFSLMEIHTNDFRRFRTGQELR